MARKVQDKVYGGTHVAPKRPSARPQRPAAKPKPDAKPVATPSVATGGAKALIRAGLKALGEVPGDMVARQTRVFELLLGIGQSPAWPTNSGERKRSLADPFGKFEEVFDQRVARALERLGVPSPQVLQALAEQAKLIAEVAAEPPKPAPSKPRRR